MKKKLLLLLILTLNIALIFTACSQNATEEEKNDKIQEATASEIGKYLYENLKFADTLEKVDSELLADLYLLDKNELEDVAFYVPTYTSEEIAVIKVKDNLDKFKKACEDRIEFQKAAFGMYKPDEVEKLENAYIYAKGNTVIVVVSNDKEAVVEALKDFAHPEE